MQLLRNMLKFSRCWTGDLAAGYKALRQVKSRIGKCAAKEQVTKIIEAAKRNEYWQLAMWCAAVAIGAGCRGGEIRRLQLGDIDLGSWLSGVRSQRTASNASRVWRLRQIRSVPTSR
jgi:integrase